MSRIDWAAAPKQRPGVWPGEPASRERLREVEFKGLIDADHRTETQNLVLGKLSGEIRLLGALPRALGHIGKASRLLEAETPGIRHASIGFQRDGVDLCGFPDFLSNVHGILHDPRYSPYEPLVKSKWPHLGDGVISTLLTV